MASSRLPVVALLLLSTAMLQASAQLLKTVAPAIQNGCDRCAHANDCSIAYLDGPGQYCGPWLDPASQRRSCCCPIDATCDRGTYTCNCKRASSSAKTASASTSAPGKATSSTTKKKEGSSWVPLVLGGIVILAAIVAGVLIWRHFESKPRSGASAPTYEHPIEPQPLSYLQSQQPEPQAYRSALPLYGSAFPAAHSPQMQPQRFGGMGTGVAMGAAAGLMGGVLLSGALSNREREEQQQSDSYATMEDETFAGDF